MYFWYRQSPMSIPIFCVVKQNRDICLGYDYRYVHLFTVADAHPMPIVDEVIVRSDTQT